MHVKYHNAVLSIKKHRKIKLRQVTMGLQMEIFRKKDRCIIISEHKQYSNESYTE